MPGPQSTFFFLLMVAAFAGLMWWLVVTRQVVFRVLAACLAFIPAMLFGVAAVNKYYDYYQNWSAAFADLINQGGQAPQVTAAGNSTGAGFSRFLGNNIDYGIGVRQGFTVRLTVPGPASGITRTVFVYLPPQYFCARDRRDFPAIELIHGFPGVPQVTARGRAGVAVLAWCGCRGRSGHQERSCL